MEREVMYGGSAGGGKALALTTPILTTNGWKTMGDLAVGDKVFDEVGTPTTIVAKSEVMRNRDTYDVVFSTGETIVADAQHEWVVVNRQGSLERLTTERLSRRMGRNHGFSIPYTQPLRPSASAPSIVHPYTLGVYYGLVIAHGEEWRHNFTTELVWEVGKVEDRTISEGGSLSFLDQDLIAAKASTSCIPDMYKFARLTDRHMLLQGIVDACGQIGNDGLVHLSFTSPVLFNDVVALIRSFGAMTYIREMVGEGGHYWLSFGADIRLYRAHKDGGKQYISHFRGVGRYHRIVTIRKRDTSVPVQCIKVNSLSRLYLAGKNLIPTHNSDALLMAASQFVDVPGYSALILRRTWPDLNSPGAILDRARTWWAGMDTVHIGDGGRVFTFYPSGARIQFGYLQRDADRYKFQSAEYQFVGFDELTHFTETQYTYLFSRVRRPQVSCLNCGWALERITQTRWKHTTKNPACREVYPDPKVLEQYKPLHDGGMTVFDVPLRMRAATNPGGVGHEWVRSRFVSPKTRADGAVFIPASLRDNPSLDQKTYVENLAHLTPTDRARLLDGDWDVYELGDYFSREMFTVIPNYEMQAGDQIVRYWDRASTKDGGDYTVGTKLVFTKQGRWVVLDVVRGQWSSLGNEQMIARTASNDGVNVPIRMEQEPGSSGKDVIDQYKRNVLYGYNFAGIKSTGSKEDRAAPFAGAAEAGHVSIVEATWNRAWLDELSLFPVGANDDQVDSVSGAANFLAFARRSRLLA
jgi:predicted phage terminase large subunit-like protein